MTRRLKKIWRGCGRPARTPRCATMPRRSNWPSGQTIAVVADGPTSSTRWPPLTLKRGGFRKPWRPPAKPWNLPHNRTIGRWPTPCGLGSPCMKPASPINRRVHHCMGRSRNSRRSPPNLASGRRDRDAVPTDSGSAVRAADKLPESPASTPSRYLVLALCASSVAGGRAGFRPDCRPRLRRPRRQQVRVRESFGCPRAKPCRGSSEHLPKATPRTGSR